MSTSGSKKQIGFCSKPVGESNVSDIPGLGKAAFSVLKSFGYEKAYSLIGQYLILNKKDHVFQNWLIFEIGLKESYAKKCTDAVAQWTINHI